MEMLAFLLQGPSILVRDEQKRGLVPRVVDGLFDCIKSSEGTMKYSIKLSMVLIYLSFNGVYNLLQLLYVLICSICLFL
jgi:ABC-type branched-subunit amino acid transport system ATPase component